MLTFRQFLVYVAWHPTLCGVLSISPSTIGETGLSLPLTLAARPHDRFMPNALWKLWCPPIPDILEFSEDRPETSTEPANAYEVMCSLFAGFLILNRVMSDMVLLEKIRCINLLRRASRTLLPAFSGKVFRLFCCILGRPMGRHFDLATVCPLTIFCFQIGMSPGSSWIYPVESPVV